VSSANLDPSLREQSPTVPARSGKLGETGQANRRDQGREARKIGRDGR